MGNESFSGRKGRVIVKCICNTLFLKYLTSYNVKVEGKLIDYSHAVPLSLIIPCKSFQSSSILFKFISLPLPGVGVHPPPLHSFTFFHPPTFFYIISLGKIWLLFSAPLPPFPSPFFLSRTPIFKLPFPLIVFRPV